MARHMMFQIIPALVLTAAVMFAQAQPRQTAPWKGSALLGNGTVCAVYSDDNRITAQTGGQGIQHFYIDDYTMDFIRGTVFEPLKNDVPLKESAPPVTGRANAYGVKTTRTYEGGLTMLTRCIATEDIGVVLSAECPNTSAPQTLRFTIRLRTRVKTYESIFITSMSVEDRIAYVEWSNGKMIMATARSEKAAVVAKDSTVVITQTLQPGERMDVLIVGPDGGRKGRKAVAEMLVQADPFASATRAWDEWMDKGVQPPANTVEGAKYRELFRQNLYAVKAVNLKGRIPADVTGGFLTDGMPQMYPRDAMMCARALMETKHFEDAKQIIEFWNPRWVPTKNTGEYYARYDARCKAVDGGTGARYDEPEWDANGYLLQLTYTYYRVKGVWLFNKETLYEVADFLAEKIDGRGLLFEGGIVEWTGYLPATNMICAAGLYSATMIARAMGDEEEAAKYQKAVETIERELPFMFDRNRQTFVDVRYLDRKNTDGSSTNRASGDSVRLWDSSWYFGLLWGYPHKPEHVASNTFQQTSTVILGGGMQYFDSRDEGLNSYGHGAFFFTTAAAAQYNIRYGSMDWARRHMEWMAANANIYGLMPERIYPDGSDCCEASPLSWCCGEFALAALRWTEKAK